MDATQAALDVAIARHGDDALNLLAELVACPSVLGNVRPAQERLCRRARQIGLNAHLWDLDPESLVGHPDYAPTDWSPTGQPNLTAVLNGGGSGRSLVLNGHVDVVSADPVDRWTFDPWAATVVGGRMYGRGALDMRSGLVAGLLALQAIIETGIPLDGRVIFESVIEEECTGNGMLASRLQSGPVDGVLILEPTDLQTWVATPGVLWFEVAVRGKPAYVGRAGEYVNAVETAARLIGRLTSRIPPALNDAFDHPDFAQFDQPLTLNAGMISGGDWPSKVPLECRFTCRMSFPIAWSFATARAFVEEQLRSACAEEDWLIEEPPTLRFPGFRARGWEVDRQGSLFKALAGGHRAALGNDLGEIAFPGTADARYIRPDLGQQAAYYGPSGGNIHAPDEYVDIASVLDVARVLARVIVDWCGPR